MDKLLGWQLILAVITFIQAIPYSDGIPCPKLCTCDREGDISDTDCTGRGLKELPDPKEMPNNLITLKLGSNNLTRVPPSYFSSLQNLKCLDLSNNQIFGDFSLPTGLQYLDLSGNKMESQNLPSLLKGLTKLDELNLSFNNLSGILPAKVFKDLWNLSTLRLNHNMLNALQPGAFTRINTLYTLNISNNVLKKLSRNDLAGLTSLNKLLIANNQISKVEDAVFESLAEVNELDLSGNQLTEFPDLTGLKNVTSIDLSKNKLKNIIPLNRFNITWLNTLNLDQNEIDCIDGVFDQFNVSNLYLSFNNISYIPDEAFSSQRDLTTLSLHGNKIKTLSNKTFSQDNHQLQLLILSNNSIDTIEENTFDELRLPLIMFLHDNKLTKLGVRPFKGPQFEKIYLFGNNITNISPSVMKDLKNVKLALDCSYLQKLPYKMASTTILCAPRFLDWISVTSHTVQVLNRAGWFCDQTSYKCKLCDIGHVSGMNPLPGDKCKPCPPGGFYQDALGGVSCKLCPVGTFIPPIIAPGKSITQCRACPQGTKSNETSGTRACPCLADFYRTNRFGNCQACPGDMYKCEKDVIACAPGYYWDWNNRTFKDKYKQFVRNILTSGLEYDSTFSEYTGPLPVPYKCVTDGCMGGVESECAEGYHGMLCSLCSSGFYKKMNSCLKCPSKLTASLQIAASGFLFLLVILAVIWGDSRKLKNKRTATDIILSCFKIVIGFYQVMSGIFSAFSDIKWPRILVSFGNYLHFIELNVIYISPLRCIDPKLQLNAFQEFTLAMAVNFGFCFISFVYLGLRICWIKKRFLRSFDQRDFISSTKRAVYRNIFLFLFTTYPSTCVRIIQILPPSCHEFKFDKNSQLSTSYLSSDMSIICSSDEYKLYSVLAMAALIYPIGFPLLILFMMWKYYFKSYTHTNSANSTGAWAPCALKESLSLFYENYKPGCWYWESLEMIRKLVLTSGIVFIGRHSRTQIGVGAIVAALFALLHVALRPIKNRFENFLQTVALMAVFLNLSIGVMLRTKTDKDSADVNEKYDETGVSILLVFLNCLVIGVIVVAYMKAVLSSIVQAYKQRKGGCQCCLAVLIPIVSLREDVSQSQQEVTHRYMHSMLVDWSDEEDFPTQT